MKTKFYILIFTTFLISGTVFAQDTLKFGGDLNKMIQDASSGQTIIVSQGFHDAQDQGISVLNKSIVIKGEEGPVKPVLYVSQFDVAGTDINFVIEGLELSGATLVDSLTGEVTDTVLAADYLINLTADNVSTNNIILKNCVIRNFNRSIFRGDRSPAHTADTIMLDDCIAFDFRGGGDYGPFRFKSNITINHFIIKNTTMYNFLNKLVDFQDVVSSPMNIEIDQCTFYGWGGGKDGQYLFDIQDNDQASLKITNSILGKTNDETVLVRAFRFLEEAYAEISFSAMTEDFVVDTAGAYDRVPWDVDEWNETDVDPGFAYPDTGNFELPVNSDLREMNEEGGPIGDPRWAVLIPTQIKETEQIRLIVYPNPATEFIHINSDSKGTGKIYNILGHVVKEMRIESGAENTFDIRSLNKGVYFLKLNNTAGAHKLVIQ